MLRLKVAHVKVQKFTDPRLDDLAGAEHYFGFGFLKNIDNARCFLDTFFGKEWRVSNDQVEGANEFIVSREFFVEVIEHKVISECRESFVIFKNLN